MLVASGVSAAAGAPAGARSPAAQGESSLAKGYEFLEEMMDRYAGGSGLRLVQSYSGGPLERQGVTDSFTYDDALIVDALLARGSSEDLARARVLGDSLLYVQEHDPAHDGRIRAAYEPTPLREPADVQATDATSDVGNMAWVGQALLQLYLRTGAGTYLSGADELASWIQANALDERGAGGYTGGQSPSGQSFSWKSTEHNIDLSAFFTLLAGASGETVWASRAQVARHFVESMWNPAKGMFWVGTGEDGVSPNKHVLAEDVNSWSYLALRDPAYESSIDWDVKNLAVDKRGFSGVSFCKRSRKGVWFEGTAHLADALLQRAGPGDAEAAERYLQDIAHAQQEGPNTDGLGIIAASRDGVGDCEGEAYDASLHTGATAWYALALQGADPFQALP